jgi:hypothetical protein
MMDQKNKNTLLVALLALFITACKKYPENNVWFSNPEKRAVLNGYLQMYEVNGIDSLELLNNYFPVPGNPGLIRDIKECEFVQTEERSGLSSYWLLGGSCILVTGQTFTKKGKKIKIFCEYSTLCFRKNIFINPDIEWTILYFPDKKKPIIKIKTTLENGNTYKIQIGH